MNDNGSLDRAEEELEKKIPSENVRKITDEKRWKKGKLVIAVILFLVLAGSSWNAYNQIKKMNTPPHLSRETLLENMGGYLFVTVSKLNAYIDRTGDVPETELDFLGWDDPSIIYSSQDGSYSVSVQSDDTVLVWNSGEDVSEFLSEEALRRMGVSN